MRATLLLGFIVAATLCGFRAAPEDVYRGEGSLAPDLVLADLDGEQRALFDPSPGWTLLKFGTTWCPSCGDQVTVLNALADFLAERGVRVVEVFIRESAKTVRQELSSRPRRYGARTLVDRAGDSLPAYAVSEIPRLLLVDPEGRVKLDARYQGADALRARLEPLVPAAR